MYVCMYVCMYVWIYLTIIWIGPISYVSIIRNIYALFDAYLNADPDFKGTVSEERFQAFLRRSSLQDRLTATQLKRLDAKVRLINYLPRNSTFTYIHTFLHSLKYTYIHTYIHTFVCILTCKIFNVGFPGQGNAQWNEEGSRFAYLHTSHTYIHS